MCPSFPGVDAPFSCYAGVHHHAEAPIDKDNTGVLFLNSGISWDELVDGPAYTLLLGEKNVRGPQDLGWLSGTPATLRNTGAPINRDLAFRRAVRPNWDSVPPWVEPTAAPYDPAAEWTEADSDMSDEELYGIALEEEEAAGEGSDDEAKPADGVGANNADEATESPPSTEDAVAADEQSADGEDKPKQPVDPFIPRGGNPRAPLRVGGFGSHHIGGANFAFADGSLRFLIDGISKGVFQRLGNRKDGKIVDAIY
jgi:prepilin-type processing-associated H-X9-DG protein